MPSNQTANYNLSQWVKSDQVKMEDFNADNARIDAALKAQANSLAGKASSSALSSLQTTVNGKASQSALDELSTTVSGKASQSALNTLSATVTQHTTSLSKKGNCQLYTTSYTGDGVSGTQKSLTFPSQPQLVVIGGNNGYLLMLQGATIAPCALGSSLYMNGMSWSGNSVSWSHNGSGGAGGMMNRSDSTYHVLALLKAD